MIGSRTRTPNHHLNHCQPHVHLGFSNPRRIYLAIYRILPKSTHDPQHNPSLRCPLHDCLRPRDIIRPLKIIPRIWPRASFWGNNDDNDHLTILNLAIQSLLEVAPPTKVHCALLPPPRPPTHSGSGRTFRTPYLPPHRPNGSIRLWSSKLTLLPLRRNANLPVSLTPRLYLHPPSGILTHRLHPNIIHFPLALQTAPPPKPDLQI